VDVGKRPPPRSEAQASGVDQLDSDPVATPREGWRVAEARMRHGLTLELGARARRGAAAVLTAILGAGCATLAGIEPPEVHLVGIAPLESTAFEQRLQIELRLINPNDRPLEIDGLRLGIEVNGRRLVTAVSSERLTLPRLGDATLAVTATTTWLDLLNQVLGLAGGRPESLEYRVSGRIFLAGAGGGIDFEHAGSSRDWIPPAGHGDGP
jgi:LEA14-like dessication related protein